MKPIALATFLVAFASSPLAFADEAESPAAPPDAPSMPAPTEKNSPAVAPARPADAPAPDAPKEPSSDAPAAQSGFQLGLRAGFAAPFGNTAGSESMSDGVSAQGTFTIDIGGKFHPNWFVGGYLGFGVGGVAGQLYDVCKTAGASCAAATVRIGAEIQYNVSPGGHVNPWFGYGIGLESLAASASAGGRTVSTGGVGPEFAHLMGGVDFRLSHGFGIGPFIDISVAQYSSATTDDGNVSRSSSIENKALHEWLQFGVRGVVFP